MQKTLEQVMALQSHYSAENTPDMRERGLLIRKALPEWIQSFSGDLADAAGVDPEDLLIEGRDGSGLKSQVPWVRFGSRQRSPKATDGWYCVYLFDAPGNAVYLCLGHGSSIWTGGDFAIRPSEELRTLSLWARAEALPIAKDRTDLLEGMSLEADGHLPSSYEAATAYCVRYKRDAVPDQDRLRDDGIFFARMLGVLYAAADLGAAPGTAPPEILEVLEVIDSVSGKKSATKSGQGFNLTGQHRKAVELHAMQIARTHLESEGWTVEDTSSTKPYDFHCTRGDVELFVEVKGTTSLGTSVLLTRNEVEHHKSVHPQNALAVVARIDLSGPGKNMASGGQLHFVSPWRIIDEDLKVLAYTYSVGT
jgi:hypothetical protein